MALKNIAYMLICIFSFQYSVDEVYGDWIHLVDFSAILDKGGNFGDFLFAFCT